MKKYLHPFTYINLIKQQWKCFLLKQLSHKANWSGNLNNVWKIKVIENSDIQLDSSGYFIFGETVLFDKVNWHADYKSGFVYPLKSFYKINIAHWFNKGIDVKFPWELSRFYFSIDLAKNYCTTKDPKQYVQFKNLLIDWIDQNPFLVGVNWICPMEVAIRAMNWIVACDLFGPIFCNDITFKQLFSKTLIQHAEYISAFPEIYRNGHTTNHALADYSGLLFLAVSLKEHPKSPIWLHQAVIGLEKCMDYQVYNDGMNFEGAVSYHRLVLELFGFAAVSCKSNAIVLSNAYYSKLFKMFEFTAAYLDYNGNAPQVGDNDSGRALIFHNSIEQDHSYLLDLGEHIFNYQFKSQCLKRNPKFVKYLPELLKIEIKEIDVNPRETNKSIAFDKGGAYCLKNTNFSLFISCFPSGQYGRGGHNHYDLGSFTLSYKGFPIVVDPGTYTYTRNKDQRNFFKATTNHNIPIHSKEHNAIVFEDDYWELKNNDMEKQVSFFENCIELKFNSIFSTSRITRKIELLKNSVKIEDVSDDLFLDLYHLNPAIKVNTITKTLNLDDINVQLISESAIQFEEYNYSPGYDQIERANRIVVRNKNKVSITFNFPE